MNIQNRKLLGATVLFVTSLVVLFGTDKATFDQWQEFIKWV